MQHSHVGICEYNASECIKTNVDGVDNVIQAAIACNVEKVIFTSSDKAVNPTSTMGVTKLLGERLIIAANSHVGTQKTRFSVVRFGNVLDSSGSVCQIFKQQLREGIPLTITSKDMTRFFLSINDAVELTLQSLHTMIGAEIFILNMGACSIMSLARILSDTTDPECVFIGAKPGEKLYEELATEIEALRIIHDHQTIIILPESVETLPVSRQIDYEKYRSFSPFTECLASHKAVLLDEPQLLSLLKKSGVVN